MSNLSTNDKIILENLFHMRDGYVLDFSDTTISRFFDENIGIDIYSHKYDFQTGSKANRMRAFWKEESDEKVGILINELIDYIKTKILINEFNSEDYPDILVAKAKEISKRLCGNDTKNIYSIDTFLKEHVEKQSIHLLNLDKKICAILRERIDEIEKCLFSGIGLGTIFLCGSTLEGILYGISQQYKELYNNSKFAPNDREGKVKKFKYWSLKDYIAVSGDVGIIKKDVVKFSQSIREFRNYIHPYRQNHEKFNPNFKTAEICYKVLMLAISQIIEWKETKNSNV